MQVGLSSLHDDALGARHPRRPAAGEAAARRRAAQPRAHPEGRARRLRRPGLDAQIDDVASAPKVGVGTVYRHFPTKDALLDALVRERFDEIAGYAERGARAATTRGRASAELIWRAAELNAPTAGSATPSPSTTRAAIVEETGLAARRPRADRRAQAQGAMRADATAADIPLMMCGCGSVVRTHPAPDVVAPLRRAHARRAARLVASPAWPPPNSPIPISPRSRGTSTRCSTAPRRRRRRALLDEAQRRADAFADAHAGQVAELDGPGLAAAMHELAALQELVGRAGSYAMLRFATATADPERGALLQKVQERGTQIETRLLFFELEWAALDDERAEELLAADGLDFARHHLRTARRYRPHLLSEPEEKILAEKSLTSSSAWTRLFEEQTAAIEVTLPRRATSRVALEIALSRLFSPDRDVRRTTRRARHRGAPARACACAATCSTRCWPRRWSTTGCAATRTGSRAATSPTRRPTSRSQALVDAVRGRYELAAPLVPAEGAAARPRPARGLRPHGRGHRRGRDDPVGGARDLVLDSFAGFSARAGRHRARVLRRARGSTRPCGPASAAARSAPTRCRARTRT